MNSLLSRQPVALKSDTHCVRMDDAVKRSNDGCKREYVGNGCQD